MKFNIEDIKYMINESVKQLIKENINSDLYKELASEIIEKLDNEEQVEEIIINDITFCFNVEINREEKNVETGVSFMGDKESYYESEWHIRGIRFDGAYDLEGNELNIYINEEILKKFIDVMKNNKN